MVAISGAHYTDNQIRIDRIINMVSNKESPIERLRKRIQESVHIPDSEWEYAKQHFHTEIYPKNSYLVKAGEKSNRVYSITRGLVRYFYITESGKEFNKYFVTDNGFFGSFSSLFLDMPCGFFIQALEETEVLAITKSSMEEMYSRHICWERVGRLSAMAFICHMELREKEFLLDPLEVRYTRLIREHPDLIDRIPQYHIASYLGVTDVALSRMRKKNRHS